MKPLNKAFWPFYIVTTLRNGAFWLPTLYIYILSLGLSYGELMWLLTTQAISQIIFELPSGISGDIIGRKWTLAMAAGLQVIGGLFLVTGVTFWPLLIAFAFLGAGYAFNSGTDMAYVYDTLREYGEEEQFKKYQGYVLTAAWLGLGVGSFLGSFLAVIDPRLPSWFTIVSCGLAGLLTLFLREPKISSELPEHHYFQHLRDASLFVSTHPRIRWLTLFSGLILAVCIVSFRFMQSVLKAAGIPIPYFGSVYLVWLLISIAAARRASLFERVFGERGALLAIAIAAGISFILVASPNATILLVGSIPLQLAYGFVTPVVGDYINRHVESSHRATVLSFRGFTQSILSAIFAPLLGLVADGYGLTTMMVSLGVIAIVGGVVLTGLIVRAPAVGETPTAPSLYDRCNS